MTDFKWAVFQANLDPVMGAAQKGNRPVLVVSNEGYNRVIPNVTVIPLTSTKRRLYPSEVLLPANKAGQAVESIIMAHQVRTISKNRLGRLLGYLEDPGLREEVRKALIEHLDLD